MITSSSIFDTLYNVKDGEVASAAVLSRPSDRLKLELNEVSYLIDIVTNDITKIPDWNANIYEVGSLVSFNSKIYRALEATANDVPTEHPDKWEDKTTLVNNFASIVQGEGLGGTSILEFLTFANFPATGVDSTIYIDLSTNTIYRYSGSEYVALSAGSASGNIIMGIESFNATEGQVEFALSGTLDHGVVVYLNGILQGPDTYEISESENKVTLDTPLTVGTRVQIGTTTATVLNTEGYIPATRYTFTATAGQTSFSAIYVIGNVDVFRNGLKLASSDYTATSGTVISLSEPAALNDNIEILSYTSFDDTLLEPYVKTTGAIMTGPFSSLREVHNEITLQNIDLSIGNFFSKTITADTVFTVSNIPTSGQVFTLTTELTNAGAHSLTFFNGVKWPGGTIPTLTASGTDVLSFYTRNGGTSWMCTTINLDLK